MNAERDVKGRFLPGASGNPAGKRPGTRNRATLLAATLAEGEAEAMLRLVADKALAGDGVAARYCLDRVMPRPRGRPIQLELPEAAGAEEIVAAFGTLLAAMAAGEITPEEALTVSRILEGKRRALETALAQKGGSHHEGTKSTKGEVTRVAHQRAISSVTASRSRHRDEATMALQESSRKETDEARSARETSASCPSSLRGSSGSSPPPHLHSACKSWLAGDGTLTALARMPPPEIGAFAVAPPQLRGEIAALLRKLRGGGLPPAPAIRFNGCEAAH